MSASDFNTDLAMSDSPEVADSIEAACRAYFGKELLAVHKAHKTNDKLGVDFWLEFSGKMEALDVKIRRFDYSLRGDSRTCCLELMSNIGTGKPGWSTDPSKLTDWILFHYLESGLSVIYSARQLRSAVNGQLPELRKFGKPAVQATKSGSSSYQSESLFVSHRELGAAIYRNANR